ncbi:hypothetical protein P170DRAFT_364881 [Aspergillus steynii IBT 23096]|uniref:Nitrogen regulatory protein areA GATA-like domain-containing protein n=1 Tax=Aspergillus steynii IBT 23096 TaxID=1392250 RepID=A0A2I2FZ38_9EURO|nr:uncharacterized protein P170DRAFT_364881 [Aspergillus steynii IBT 23096]PLB45899.1 hypothetical protein P170DRAFT_364881 [Aspergillus steynii IBT 23096]
MDELPKGLVSSTGQVPSTLEDETAVDVGDIVQLWKAYSANASVHEGDMGHRLENFFWRIWSSEDLCRSIDGSRLAKLFLRISEASPLSLATPQPTTTKAPQARSHTNIAPNDDKSPSSNGSSRTPMPPPILKKSNTSHGETQKTTRLLLTGVGGQSITRKPSTPPTPVPPPSRKAYFVAGKAKSNKRRPVLMRRKSSQTSSGASTRTHSPQRIPTPLTSTSPVQISEQDSGSTTEMEEPSVEEPPEPGKEAKETTAGTNELPASFLTSLKGILGDKWVPSQGTKSTPPKWGYVTRDDFTHYDVNFLSAENYAPQPSSSSLVDKDFRTRFAERKRQEYEELVPSLGEAADADATNAAPQATTNWVSPTSASSGIPIMTPATGSMSSAGRMTGDATPSPQTSMSAPKGRSQLSVLIEESRNKQADTQVVSIPEDALNSAE